MMENSTNTNIANIINSTFFFIKPLNNDTKINMKIFQHLESILFTILAIRINKKIYSFAQSKNITSFNHKKNMSILYQFLLTNIKFSHALKK